MKHLLRPGPRRTQLIVVQGAIHLHRLQALRMKRCAHMEIQHPFGVSVNGPHSCALLVELHQPTGVFVVSNLFELKGFDRVNSMVDSVDRVIMPANKAPLSDLG